MRDLASGEDKHSASRWEFLTHPLQDFVQTCFGCHLLPVVEHDHRRPAHALTERTRELPDEKFKRLLETGRKCRKDELGIRAYGGVGEVSEERGDVNIGLVNLVPDGRRVFCSDITGDQSGLASAGRPLHDAHKLSGPFIELIE